nr:MAG TPA: endonuclease [Caudoviricetes sp.]
MEFPERKPDKEKKRKEKEILLADKSTSNNRVLFVDESTHNTLYQKEEINQEEKVVTKGRVVRFTPPTVEEVRNYISEKGYEVNADNFVDFYESKGWMIGKNKMKDWKAAVRTWNRMNNNRGRDSKKQTLDVNSEWR